jgi:hypothetical protein
MSEFKSSEKTEGQNLVLTFEGTIDEDMQFPAIVLKGQEKIVIDLHSVKAINSVGIREWLNWIRPLAEQLPIELIRCPKAIVFQFNMVEGFLPKQAKVSSFYVPFYCEKCDREDNVLFNVGTEVTVSAGVVAIEFDKKAANLCKSTAGECEAEMDVTESKYFQFLKKMAA